LSAAADPFPILQELRAAAAFRANEITTRYADWPCRKGCADCCRSLARPPELSEIEWREVEAGLALLPAAIRSEVEARRARHGEPPQTCAFLDQASGACLIYAHRPIVCRTYGFYMDDRGIGFYCGLIRRRVEAGEFAEAVWGNHSACEHGLDALGPRRQDHSG
jgi:uncharacterized protein